MVSFYLVIPPCLSDDGDIPRITVPSNVDAAGNLAPPPRAPRARPRGRPPANTKWDARLGRYIPVVTGSRQPRPQLIWAMVTTARVHEERTPLKPSICTKPSKALMLTIDAGLLMQSFPRCGSVIRGVKSSAPPCLVGLFQLKPNGFFG